jgi:serine/threonine protein kinase
MAEDFGRYRLVRKLGEGGLAEVFAALPLRSSGAASADAGSLDPGAASGSAAGPASVALKRMRRELARDPRLAQLFADEARLTAGLRHPHVVTLLDAGVVDDIPYLVHELVDGGDLAALLEALRAAGRPGLPPGPALRLMAQVCAGLHHVHRARRADGQPLGLVHGDVTPSNILVGRDQRARIGDFSVAVSTADQRSGTVRGTYAYMSPEQVRGEVLDARSDVFAAAVIVWELLANRRLFHRSAAPLTLRAVVDDPVPPLAAGLASALPPAMAADCDALLAHALCRQRDERLPSCADLGAALEALATRVATG